jgi:hypothetical protein
MATEIENVYSDGPVKYEVSVNDEFVTVFSFEDGPGPLVARQHINIPLSIFDNAIRQRLRFAQVSGSPQAVEEMLDTIFPDRSPNHQGRKVA